MAIIERFGLGVRYRLETVLAVAGYIIKCARDLTAMVRESGRDSLAVVIRIVQLLIYIYIYYIYYNMYNIYIYIYICIYETLTRCGDQDCSPSTSYIYIYIYICI